MAWEPHAIGSDGGYITIDKESAYGTAGGSPSSSLIYLEGSDSFGDARETIPRPGVGSMATSEQVQVRNKCEGGFSFWLDFSRFLRLFYGALGDGDDLNGAIDDNCCYYGADLPTWTIVKFLGGTKVTYPGNVISELRIYQENGEPVMCDVNFVGEKTSTRATNSATSTAHTGALKEALCDYFQFDSTDLKERVHAWEIKITNPLREDLFPVAASGRGQASRMGSMIVEVSLSMLWTPEVLALDGQTGWIADLYDDAATVPLVIRFEDDIASPAEQLIIEVPAVKIVGDEPRVNESGVPVVTIRGLAVDGSVNRETAANWPELSGLTWSGSKTTPIAIGVSTTEAIDDL
jgi:hypothetical protein